MALPSHYESTLEKVICEGLDLVGWVLGDKDNYSRPLGLDVQELRLFMHGRSWFHITAGRLRPGLSL
jgi:hypothetical protein